MKKILIYTVTLFAFMMIANVANAQMFEDGFANARPATGTSDNDYPNVRWLINNAKVPTIGVLKSDAVWAFADKYHTFFLNKEDKDDGLHFYGIYNFNSNGRTELSFILLLYDNKDTVEGCSNCKRLQQYKVIVNKNNGRSIKEYDPIIFNPDTGNIYDHKWRLITDFKGKL